MVSIVEDKQYDYKRAKTEVEFPDLAEESKVPKVPAKKDCTGPI